MDGSQSTSTPDSTKPDTTQNIQLQTKEIPLDLQRFMLDPEPLKTAFNFLFCGWILVPKPQTKTMIGITKIETINVVEIDKKSRICNESGANYLYYSVSPLINQLSSTSDLQEIMIYNLWNAKMITLITTLARSIYFEGNPYEFKEHRVGDVITQLSSHVVITMKAHKGFTTRELAETIISSTLSRLGVQEKEKGFFDKFFHRGG
jgi:hypothetical protein